MVLAALGIVRVLYPGLTPPHASTVVIPHGLSESPPVEPTRERL